MEGSPKSHDNQVRRKLAVSSLQPYSHTNDTAAVNEKLSDDAPFPIVPMLEPEPAPTTLTSRKIIFSLVLLMLATCSGVADSQLAKQAYSEKFNAPFFMMYCSQVVRLFTYPVFLLVSKIAATVKRKPFGLQEQLHDGLLLYGPKGPTVLSVLKIIPVLGTSNIAGLGLYMSSLSFISASEATTLMTSQVAMIYVISVIFLKQPVLTVKIFATALSFSGVALTAYAKGFQSDSAAGITIALITSVIYACSQTYMKVVLKYPKFGQICMYMTSTAIFTLCVGWIFPLAMKVTGLEIWDIYEIPWLVITGSCVASLLTALFVNYGISVSSPFFMSMYNLIRIPINNLIDAFARGQVFAEFEIVGAILIAIGFILIVLPDKKMSIDIQTRVNKMNRPKSSSDTSGNDATPTTNTQL